MAATITPPTPLTPRLEAALLPWESAAELVALHAELVAEHQPQGPTEKHLVEELALLLWRKRRVADAERALHLAVLHDHVESSYTATKIASRALVCSRDGRRGSGGGRGGALERCPRGRGCSQHRRR